MKIPPSLSPSETAFRSEENFASVGKSANHPIVARFFSLSLSFFFLPFFPLFFSSPLRSKTILGFMEHNVQLMHRVCAVKWWNAPRIYIFFSSW